MGYGGGVGLIVVGLILALAVNDQQVGPLDVSMIGWILVLGGVLLLVLSIFQNNQRRASRTVATTTDSQGRQATSERYTESDPPAPPAV